MTDQPPNRPISLLPPSAELLDRSSFSAALTKLHLAAGQSLREYKLACKRGGHPVSHNTIDNWFKGVIVQRRNELAFTIVLGLLGVTDPADQKAWLDAARDLRARRTLRAPVAPSVRREPYRGLDVYDVEHVRSFYGRSRLISMILSEIDELHSLGGGAVQLVGASGAGKSSVLRAGVIASLRRGELEGSTHWPVLLISTGPNPLRSLAEAVAQRLDDDVDRIEAQLADEPEAVVRRLRDIVVEANNDAKLVVIVDQFEQALVKQADAAEQGPLELFLAALKTMTSRIVRTAIVIGMRLDVFDAALNHPGLRSLTRRPHIIVEPMTDAELREVIERPAQDVGVEPEPGFADLLLRDVSARSGKTGHQAGTLPLLSHALHVTWDESGGTAMTVANYLASGGVDGALRESADEVYQKLTLAQQRAARRMFFTLVHLHPSGSDTRRRISQDDLFEEVGESADLELVLDRFVAQRLLTVGENSVEITHEALLEAWPVLRGWLDADRAGLLVEQQLISDARAWADHGRPDTDLYVGTRLQAARDRSTHHSGQLPEFARDFVAVSVRQSQRRTRRLRATVAVLTVLILGAATLTAVVLVQGNTLQRQRDEAQSRTLASLVSALRDKDIALSRQLALAAYRISPTVEARSALLDATALRPAVRMRGGEGNAIMYAVALHPAGTIAAAATENTVRFWDITKPGHPAARPDLPSATCGKIYALAFSPNGNLLAASCGDGTIRLWDTHDPLAPTPLPPLTDLGHKAKVYSVSFSPDGTMMAAAIAEPQPNDIVAGTVRLWRLTGLTPAPLGQPLRVDDDSPAKSVSFHPSNRYLAVGTNDGTVQIWDTTNPEQPTDPTPASGPTKAIGQLSFSPDGNTLAAGGADFLVHLWTTTDPHNPVPAGPPIAGADTWINAVSFSPDSSTLAIASSDATVGIRLLDLSTRHVTATMPHPAPATSVKFSADGKTVISGANDGTARIWPIATTALEGMDYIVSATRFSTNGTMLAVGSRDLQLFDTTIPHQLKPYGPALPNPDGFSGTLSFAPNNRLLAEGRGRSGTVQLWNVSNPAKPGPVGPPLQAATQQIETLTINSDSTLLATGSRDGTVKLWNIQTPETPTLLSTPGKFDGFVNEVSFSPTGKLFAAGSVDKTVRLWDISDPHDPRPVGSPLTPANHYVYSTVFSPDGTMLAISLADSTVRLYDITDAANPRPIGSPLIGPENYVQSLSFTTDGTTLAAAGNDGTLWIWDVHDRANPTVYATLTIPTGALYPVHFQPHTRLLAGGSGDKKAWTWTIDIDAAAALVCDTSGDPITRDEWAKYVKDRDYSPPCP